MIVWCRHEGYELLENFSYIYMTRTVIWVCTWVIYYLNKITLIMETSTWRTMLVACNASLIPLKAVCYWPSKGRNILWFNSWLLQQSWINVSSICFRVFTFAAYHSHIYIYFHQAFRYHRVLGKIPFNTLSCSRNYEMHGLYDKIAVVCFKFHWNLLTKFQISLSHHWFR